MNITAILNFTDLCQTINDFVDKVYIVHSVDEAGIRGSGKSHEKFDLLIYTGSSHFEVIFNILYYCSLIHIHLNTKISLDLFIKIQSLNQLLYEFIRLHFMNNEVLYALAEIKVFAELKTFLKKANIVDSAQEMIEKTLISN